MALCRELTEPAGETSPSFYYHHDLAETASPSRPFSRFSHPASSASNRCHPLQHPKRTRFRPFWPFPGAFFSFLLVHGRKIFGFVFVQVAICWLQIEVIGDSIQPGHVLLDIVQLRYLRGGVAQQFENLA